MNGLRKRIEALVSGAREGDHSSLDRVLLAGSFLYGTGVKLRNIGYDYGVLKVRKLPCRVVSIGNLVAGGTGKTPMTIYLATLLKQMGHRPAVLSRGYGGAAEKKGIVVSDGFDILCDSDVAGDEPFMMASGIKGIPVIVGRDRYASGMRAIEEFDPDILILDDGFQHRRLHRDLDLVLMDAGKMFGNGYLLPRGALREPPGMLKRSDAIVLTRCAADTSADNSGNRRIAVSGNPGIHKPVFRTRHLTFIAGVYGGTTPFPREIRSWKPAKVAFSLLEKSSVFVFSGIAGNREFLKAIGNQTRRVVGSMAFSDHHPYTDDELEQIALKAAIAGATYIVTTQKDYVRVAGRIPGEMPIVVVDVKIAFNNQDEYAFIRFLRRKLRLGFGNF